MQFFEDKKYIPHQEFHLLLEDLVIIFFKLLFIYPFKLNLFKNKKLFYFLY